MIVIDPYFNHTAALLGDKWFSPRLGTDVALGLAIAYTWLTEGTYDKEYIAGRTTGFDEWKDYVLGKTDGVPKTPEWAEARERHPGPRDPGAGPGVGVQEDHAGRRRPGRHGRRLPGLLGQRVGPHHGRPGRHAGAGQAGQQHLGHHQRRPGRLQLHVPRLRRRRHLRRHDQLGRRLPLRQPHVPQRRGDHQPAALHRGPDGPAPAASPRPCATRRWNGGARASAARTSRASSRSTSTRPRAIPTWACTTATAARSSAP